MPKFSVSGIIAVLLSLLAVSSYAGTAQDVDWKTCKRESMGGIPIPFGQDGNFYPECAPEVLYSWRTDESLKSMVEKQKAGIGPVAGHPHGKLFATNSPLGSFPYGKNGVRIKLKEDVKYIFANRERGDFDGPGDEKVPGYSTSPIRECSYYKKKYPKDYERIVLVAYLGFYKHFYEYILCTDGPIASWSYGTSEQNEEMKKHFSDFKENPNSGDHESVNPQYPLVSSDASNHKCADFKPCSIADLNERMMSHEKMVNEKSGEVFYLDPNAKSAEDHFSRKYRYYYSSGFSESSGGQTKNDGGNAKKKKVVQ